MTKTVLLTGISGYIGLHCAQQLLNAGYTVRGSVRSKIKEKEVLETLKAASVNTKELSIIELDLTSDIGWDNAAENCDYIMHVASPFELANPKKEDEMIIPAVEGTLRVFQAAKNMGVNRVVLTSSIVAMIGSMKNGTFGPKDWTDITAKNINTYTKSKTLAEKTAWNFAKLNNIELVVINPGGVFGPPLGKNLSGQSMSSLDQMLRGKLPMVPKISFPMVDVRDVASLHVQALSNSNATGKRIVASTGQPNGFDTAAKILIDAGYKGPSTRIAPDFIFYLMAIFNREAKGMLGLLNTNLSADNSETHTLFNWTPIPFKKSVLDTAKAVKALQ